MIRVLDQIGGGNKTDIAAKDRQVGRRIFTPPRGNSQPSATEKDHQKNDLECIDVVHVVKGVVHRQVCMQYALYLK